MITADNVARHELVGMQAQVLLPAATGGGGGMSVDGIVVDETRGMLALRDGAGVVRRMPKAAGEWVFVTPDGKRVRVDGERITRRPEERLVSKA